MAEFLQSSSFVDGTISSRNSTPDTCDAAGDLSKNRQQPSLPHSQILVKKLKSNASLPRKGSLMAAGYDLHAALDEPIIVKPHGKALTPTGIAIRFDHLVPGKCAHNCKTKLYGRLAPRSGFSWHCHTTIGAGVIDEDYRGEVKGGLYVWCAEYKHVFKGSRPSKRFCSLFAHKNVLQIEN